MSYIFRSKILNNTLMGYSRKKIHTSPNYGWQDPLSPSFLPTFPGLLLYGDPFLAPDSYNPLLEALNIIYGQ